MGSRSRPKPPAPTAQEKAFARRSEISLDKETEEENRRKRLLLRNTLGSQSLLSGLSGASGSGATFKGTSFASRSGSGGGGSPTTTTLGGIIPSFSLPNLNIGSLIA